MADLSNGLDLLQVQSFLQAYLGHEVQQVRFIGAGMFSSAYGFQAAAARYVVRIGASLKAFQKDQYASTHFAAPRLPIPRVIAIGAFDASYAFAITEWVHGQTLHDLAAVALNRLVPKIVEMVDALRGVRLPATTSYGPLNAAGQGVFASWREAVLALDTWPETILSRVDETFYPFETLYRATFLERTVVEACSSHLHRLVEYCPEAQYLIHGDVGFDNALTDGNQITAVLDWAESSCGDFLYDVAYLEYYSVDIRYAEFFKAYYQRQQVAVPYFEQRLRCYLVLIALRDMFLAANRNDHREYAAVKQRLHAMQIITSA